MFCRKHIYYQKSSFTCVLEQYWCPELYSQVPITHTEFGWGVGLLPLPRLLHSDEITVDWAGKKRWGRQEQPAGIDTAWISVVISECNAYDYANVFLGLFWCVSPSLFSCFPMSWLLQREMLCPNVWWIRPWHTVAEMVISQHYELQRIGWKSVTENAQAQTSFRDKINWDEDFIEKNCNEWKVDPETKDIL